MSLTQMVNRSRAQPQGAQRQPAVAAFPRGTASATGEWRLEAESKTTWLGTHPDPQQTHGITLRLRITTQGCVFGRGLPFELLGFSHELSRGLRPRIASRRPDSV